MSYDFLGYLSWGAVCALVPKTCLIFLADTDASLSKDVRTFTVISLWLVNFRHCLVRGTQRLYSPCLHMKRLDGYKCKKEKQLK